MFHLLAREDKPLFIWRNAFPVLYLSGQLINGGGVGDRKLETSTIELDEVDRVCLLSRRYA